MGQPVRRRQNETVKPRRNVKKDGYGEFPKNESALSKLTPRNPRQRNLINYIKSRILTFAIGVAGTGKTYIAIAVGLQLLKEDKIKKIILTKPFIEIDEKLGTLPGDDKEKTALLSRPMYDAFIKLIGKSHLENLIRNETIEFVPLGSILGMSIDDSLIILDEAQNTTPAQMMVLLSRIGDYTKVVICGDYKMQKFIKGKSGLKDAIERLGEDSDVGKVEFTEDDITRSPFCKKVICAYRNNDDDD